MSSVYPRQKALFIGGSVNQTSICHEIAKHLSTSCDCFFTPYYVDHPLGVKLLSTGLLDFTVLGGKFLSQSMAYLKKHGLPVDYGGRLFDYDLVVTTSDLLIQDNIRHKRIVLVQEGMTDPENLATKLVKSLRLPPWMALNTSAFGLSDAYDYFCVASEGYRQLLIKKGINPRKLTVTGIPNFDNAAAYLSNDFPHKNYVLAATSDLRETKRLDYRKKFIKNAVQIAAGRKLIFKLHPNENVARAVKEIQRFAPGALIFSEGNTGEMVANCDVLITQYSSVAFIGLALKKEVHSYFRVSDLRKLVPVQNGGLSGRIIAALCKKLLNENRKVG
jgi:hypothetical protein